MLRGISTVLCFALASVGVCAATVQKFNCDSSYIAFDLHGSQTGDVQVAYFDSVPTGGWSDRFKKDCLLLRKVPLQNAGSSVSTPCAVSNSYYIGVFEVTRYQYALVMGQDPDRVADPVLPVDQVSWQQLRSVPEEAYSAEHDWPSRREVAGQSFFGRLRRLTQGEGFDLPTEAQWEHACCWGMSKDVVAIDAGGNEVSDRAQVRGDGGLFEVGRYCPNALGLHDMFGNAAEWCLDRAGDTKNSPGGSRIIDAFRILREGTKNTCGIGYRVKYHQHIGMNRMGFRVVLNCPVLCWRDILL